jgi:hypothetical protein
MVTTQACMGQVFRLRTIAGQQICETHPRLDVAGVQLLEASAERFGFRVLSVGGQHVPFMHLIR